MDCVHFYLLYYSRDPWWISVVWGIILHSFIMAEYCSSCNCHRCQTSGERDHLQQPATTLTKTQSQHQPCFRYPWSWLLHTHTSAISIWHFCSPAIGTKSVTYTTICTVWSFLPASTIITVCHPSFTTSISTTSDSLLTRIKVCKCSGQSQGKCQDTTPQTTVGGSPLRGYLISISYIFHIIWC